MNTQHEKFRFDAIIDGKMMKETSKFDWTHNNKTLWIYGCLLGGTKIKPREALTQMLYEKYCVEFDKRQIL
jgi:hypothetical protein